MIYVSSDWHGYPLEKILMMLDRAGFGESDTLYVLGDVIDRGAEGAELLRWMAAQPNVRLILGNHEAMLLSCSFLFRELTEERLAELTPEKLSKVQHWCQNGGGVTINGLNKILKEEPEVFDGIMDYLREASICEIIEDSGERFVLVHAGLGNFAEDKALEDYNLNDFLWTRPTLQTAYYRDATVIFGHTPTMYYGREFKGKPIFTDTWICIDTGAAGGLSPVLLRLEDMEQFFAPALDAE